MITVTGKPGGYSSTGAVLIDQFRYHLWREWTAAHLIAPRPPARSVAWVMLNPSTADVSQDDPTIRRCVGFARAWGFTRIDVVNLFAFRATSPFDLVKVAMRHDDSAAIGPRNDEHLVKVCSAADRVIAAWGVHGELLGRGRRVAELLQGVCTLEHLGLTRGGAPKHPLYLRGDLLPQTFTVRHDAVPA